MRQIGVAERALELMCRRAQERVAFGKRLAENDITLERIAQSRIEIDQARLLMLHAAWMMDTVGNKAAKQAIATIKVAVPNMTLRVLDRAIQAPRRRRREPGLPPRRLVGPLADAPVRRRARRGAPPPDRPPRAPEARLSERGPPRRPWPSDAQRAGVTALRANAS